MQTISDKTGFRAQRRKHSAQFKAQIVAACMRPDASTAAVAMAHGVNASMVRRWIGKARQPSDTHPSAVAPASPAFIPVHQQPAKAACADIRIELRRGATSISMNWPSEAAAQCAAWMREVLR